MDIKEINEEIDKLEKCEYTTYGNCYKLAALYIVRDHYDSKQEANEMKGAGMGTMMMHTNPPLPQMK